MQRSRKTLSGSMVLKSWAKAFYINLVPPSKDGGNSSVRNLVEEIKNNKVCSPNEFPLASASGNKKSQLKRTGPSIKKNKLTLQFPALGLPGSNIYWFFRKLQFYLSGSVSSQYRRNRLVGRFFYTG